tara:strand:- start:9 stop:953 length:945 start_codon:yes stop_codon:yes gene_type:complete
MANGIFDTFTTGTGGPILFPDQSPDLPPPGEILDEGLAELAQRAGIDITAQEAGDLRKTVLAGGNVGNVATDIAANIAERKRDSIISSGIASVVPEVLSPLSGVNRAVGIVNTADYLTNLAADFAQGVPVAGPTTAEMADFTGDLGQMTFDFTNPMYQGIGLFQEKIIDPITGRIKTVIDPRRLLNLINPFDDDDDRRDDDPGPGIVINQVDDNRRDDDPPVPTTVTGVSGPAGMVVDPGAVSSSFGGRGGADRGGDVVIGGSTPGTVVIGGTTGTTPGPAGMGFTPPAPERDRFPMGRAEGGLATIPRYLKGR